MKCLFTNNSYKRELTIMRIEKNIYQLILMVSSSLAIIGCQSNKDNSNNITESIYNKTDAYVESMMDSLEIVGLNYAILIDGEVVHKKEMGLANIDHQVPMTLDKLFAVASISKLFSSTALHRLLKSQNRSVEETVGEFLPDREDLPESWKELSLKYLLSHTSGIPDIIDYGIFLAPESDDFVIKNMKDKPFTSALGTESRYNATAYMLVRIIIEKLAGQDFEEHMQKNYFDKFNLSTANYGGFKKVVPNRVTSYQTVGDKLEMFPLNYSHTMYAGAGLNIKIDELILWMQALLNEQILDKDQLNTIWTPYKLNNNEVGSFGLGWEAYEFENKIKINGHGGAGISSLLHYRKDGFPNTVTVILLTNGAKNWVQSPHSVNMGIANYFMPGVNDLD